MAVVMARDGRCEEVQTGPPGAPMQLELPVLFDGFGPPDSKPTRRRHRRRPVGKAPPGVMQLDLGLVLAELLEEDKRADQAARELDAIEGVVAYESWEQSEVRRLHLFLLERSLEILADTRTGTGTVLEILDWMRVPMGTPPKGFSYRACCALAGYDADAMLEQVEYEVDRLHGLMAA